MQSPFHGIAPLPHLGVIAAQGADAATFLHGQLTQDFALLPPGQARLAAFCSAKGRMQASFIGLRWDDEQILLVCERDLLATTLKRLSMFVLRAKVKMRDASGEFQLHGLLGDAAAAVLPAPVAPWSRIDAAGGVAVGLYPADGQPRMLLVTLAGTAPPAGAALSTAQWRWTDVRSGVVLFGQPVFEALVPQMLNYESVGGVNFKKGCYPGQEVVARSQFRGTLKRRAYVAHSAADMHAGQEVFQAADAEQPCGLVVQAAAHPQSGCDAVVSLQTSAAQTGDLRVGSASGPALHLQPLPYALLDDI